MWKICKRKQVSREEEEVITSQKKKEESNQKKVQVTEKRGSLGKTMNHGNKLYKN